ncbi:DUF3117 domain-containing protein [Arcanobacterium hippocoleae]|uniref:DUF3117 domain-containing protein n=1 Tax=Arcanobacterium hippocoleae TaxID=149017 RepID=A0ABU1SZV2_9ACTO|nr:DUF3117 domain-containing protein [Arcanobacterium hippocoleae]MDR6938647.1 hypothetical protein [Arcanobacterium hippocoleae]
MAAMKPRTGDGPLEAERDNHGVTIKIPLEGGGRMVLLFKDDELAQLAQVVQAQMREE